MVKHFLCVVPRRASHPTNPPQAMDFDGDLPSAPPTTISHKDADGVITSCSPATPGGHVTVTLERTSTGGTRREVQMKRASSGAMSGAERAEKKRKRASLFPTKKAKQDEVHAERQRAERKRKADEAAAAEAAAAEAAKLEAAELAAAEAAEAAEEGAPKTRVLEGEYRV